MAEVGTAWVTIIPSFKGFGSSLQSGIAGEASSAGALAGTALTDSMSKSVSKGGSKIGAAAKLVAKFAAPLTLAGVAKGAVSASLRIDEAFDTIRTGTGATGQTLAGLQNSFKAVASTTPADVQSVAQAVTDLNRRLGVTGPTLETLARQILEAGRLTGEALDINEVTAAFGAFGVRSQDMSRALDDVFRVSQATGVGMNELTGIMAKQGATLAQLGFSFQDTASFIGILDKAGVNSSQVVASLGRSLVNLAESGESPQAAFKRTVAEIQGFIRAGNDAKALDLAGKVFGTRGAGQFVAALKSGKISLDDMSKAAGLSQDSILGVAKATADFPEQWKVFKNQATLALEPLGAKLLPLISQGLKDAAPLLTVLVDAIGALVPVLSVVAGLVEPVAGGFAELGSLIDSNKTTFLVIGGIISSVFVPALIKMGVEATISAAKTMAAFAVTKAGALSSMAVQSAQILGAIAGWVLLGAKALLSAAKVAAAWLISIGPIALVVAAVAGLVFVIIKYWDEIKAATTKVWDAIVGALSSAWNVIKTLATTVFTEIKNFFVQWWPLLLAVFTGGLSLVIGVIIRYHNQIFSFITSTWNAIIGFFRRIPGWIIGIFNGAFRWLGNAGRNIINGLRNGITAAWDGLWSWIRGLGGRIVGAVGNLGSALYDAGWDLISGLAGGIKDAVSDLLSNIDLSPGFDVPGVPFLARGAVVRGPTLAVIGEAGAESVIPHNRKPRSVGLLAATANRMGYSVVPRFADGGIVSPRGTVTIGASRAIPVAMQQRVVLDVTGGDQDLVRVVKKWVRETHGGNVQVALGS